jgi:hypothetical protein
VRDIWSAKGFIVGEPKVWAVDLTIVGRNRCRSESKAICRISNRSCEEHSLVREREVAMQSCLAFDCACHSAFDFELDSPWLCFSDSSSSKNWARRT